jgi:hypothetical protein
MHKEGSLVDGRTVLPFPPAGPMEIPSRVAKEEAVVLMLAAL